MAGNRLFAIDQAMASSRLVAIGATAAVIAAIIAGLVLSGSPATQREIRLDAQRAADLRDLSNAVSLYFDETGALPESLSSVVDGRILSQLPQDPTTGQSYRYEITGDRQFRLCAEFMRDSEPGNTLRNFWQHDAGPACFDFDFSSRRLD